MDNKNLRLESTKRIDYEIKGSNGVPDIIGFELFKDASRIFVVAHFNVNPEEDVTADIFCDLKEIDMLHKAMKKRFGTWTFKQMLELIEKVEL